MAPQHRLRRRHAVAAAALLITTLAGAAPAGAGAAEGRSAPAAGHGSGQGVGKGSGTNLLVAGLDRRSGMSRKEIQRLHVGGQECGCTDVLMLVHIAADGRRLSVVSLPRDSFVPFARHDHPAHSGKINGAYAHGGRDLTVRTVERATGLRIDHYMEADFRGFVAAVDGLGGAEVCSDRPLRDENSGLDLAAGTHDVDGRHALRYVRARHLNPPGDLDGYAANRSCCSACWRGSPTRRSSRTRWRPPVRPAR